jgi:hypothetical protein
LSLAHGVALDDHLDAAARALVDAAARDCYRRWRARCASELTVDGVDLAAIWEVELLAQCFLPAARLQRGLGAAMAALAARRLLVRDFGCDAGALVRAVAEAESVEVELGGSGAAVAEPIPRKPSSALADAVGAVGVPPRVRGDVVCVPHWSNAPLLARLAGPRSCMRPVAERFLLPTLGPRRALAAARLGGWLGVPGSRARLASRRTIAAALASARSRVADGSVEDALAGHALAVLERMAPDTLATVWQARRALADRRLRLALLPCDSPEQARMLLTATRESGIPSLVLQHGFSARLGDPDMRLADGVALWSERDRSLVADRDPDDVAVTGNPGACHLARSSGRVGSSAAIGARTSGAGRAVVLVEYPSRLSARIDRRIGARHVAAALRALSLARPGATAIVRPHPAERETASYVWEAAHDLELRVEVDARTPIESLLAGADVCVGALSTATLQACALGAQTVFLDLGGIERPWPFTPDGLPRARGVECLAEALASSADGARACARACARELARTALGVREDAVERVLDVMGGLVAGG